MNVVLNLIILTCATQIVPSEMFMGYSSLRLTHVQCTWATEAHCGLVPCVISVAGELKMCLLRHV